MITYAKENSAPTKSPSKTLTFFRTLDQLRNSERKYTDREEKLTILAWLCKEVSRLGGSPKYLYPGYTLAGDSWNKRLLVPTEDKEIDNYLAYALNGLPNTIYPGHAKETQKAMRKILEQWGTKRKGWQVLNPKWANPNGEIWNNDIVRFPHSWQFDRLQDRELTAQLNSCHKNANRLHHTNFFFDENGKVSAEVIHSYPRDCSSWTWGHRSTSFQEKEEFLPFVQGLVQKGDETLCEAFFRIIRHIESYTKEGITPYSPYSRGPEDAVSLRIKEEKTYSEIQRKIHTCGGDFHSGNVQADAKTKARFGIDHRPYSLKDETASMLAEFLCDQQITEGELLTLNKGLRRMRKVSPANKTLHEFEYDLNKRNYGHCRHQHASQQPPPPKYELLTKGLKEAQTAHAKVYAWIPKPGEQRGLQRVPWSKVKVDRLNHYIHYKGTRWDIGEIRQFDVV